MLAELRTEIATLLESIDIKCFEYMPERIVPPMAMLTAGSPFISAGNTFGSFNIVMNIELVVPTGTNEVETQSLDKMIEDVIVILANKDINIYQVDQPQMLSANNATYMMATATLVANRTL